MHGPYMTYLMDSLSDGELMVKMIKGRLSTPLIKFCILFNRVLNPYRRYIIFSINMHKIENTPARSDLNILMTFKNDSRYDLIDMVFFWERCMNKILEHMQHKSKR